MALQACDKLRISRIMGWLRCRRRVRHNCGVLSEMRAVMIRLGKGETTMYLEVW